MCSPAERTLLRQDPVIVPGGHCTLVANIRWGAANTLAARDDTQWQVTADDRLGLVRLTGHVRKPVSLAALLARQRPQGLEIWPLPAHAGVADAVPVVRPSGWTLSAPADAAERPAQNTAEDTIPQPAAARTAETARAGSTWYWVWACRAGRLSARADRCFASLEAARIFAASLEDSLDLDPARVLSPEEVRAELARLDDLGKADLRAARLMPARPVRRRRALRLVLTFLVLLATVFAAGFARDRLREQTFDQERHARHTAEAALKEEMLAHPERSFQADFLRAPDSSTFLHGRAGVALDVPLSANGWKLERVSVTAQDFSAVWRVTAAASLLCPPEHAVLDQKDVTRAVASRPLPALPAGSNALHGRWRALPERQRLTAALSEMTARFGMKMQLRWQPPERVTISDHGRECRLTCPWVRGTVVWTAVPSALALDWPSLAEALRRPPLSHGLYLNELSWQTSWQISGDVYARDE